MKIFENIYGNSATVYHRTRVEDLINRVYTEGWKPSNGSMYGKGFYSTYTFEAQLNDWMRKSYGNIIVKFVVHGIENFFIFDYDEFKKSPNYKLLGKPLQYEYLQAQFKHFNIDYEKYGFDVRKALNTIEYEGITSSIALWCYKNINGFTHRVDGIIFSGEHDGKILVSYRLHKNIVPISYTLDEGKTWNKVPYNLEHLKQVLLGPGTTKKINKLDKHEKLLPEDLGIINYKWNKDGSIDVFEDVLLNNKKLKKLPFKFNVVKGHFNCVRCELETLENCPREVYGIFDVSKNKIKVLDHCPEYVEDLFYVFSNSIEKVEKLPVLKRIDNMNDYTYVLSHNYIEYINPKVFNRLEDEQSLAIDIAWNRLEILDVFPPILHSLSASDNLLKKIRSKPFERVYRDFDISRNNLLKNLEGSPIIVEGDYIIDNSKITSLKGISRYIGGELSIKYNDYLRINNINLDDLPENVYKGVNITYSKLYGDLGVDSNIVPYSEFVRLIKRYKENKK